MAYSSSSESASTIIFGYRGEEEHVRHFFTYNLFQTPYIARSVVYEIHNDQQLEPEIERLITQSRDSTIILIIIFPPKFFESSSCLPDVFCILRKIREGNHFTLPVFYGDDAVGNLFQPDNSLIEDNEGSVWTVDTVDLFKAAIHKFSSYLMWLYPGYEMALFSYVDEMIYSLNSTPPSFKDLFQVHDMEGFPIRELYDDDKRVSQLGKELYDNYKCLVQLDTEWRSIGKLFLSTKEIARGSNGTIVFEGIYEGHNVAVKRLSRTLYHDLIREIQNLIAADKHPNIVRWYDTECDRDFYYLSLERCDCTLYELIRDNMYSESIQLMNPNGYPSPILLKLMSDTVVGLEYLHKLKIIHRDMKPQNVLIMKEECLCVKIADMGISRPLVGEASSLGSHATVSGTVGWRPAEQILERKRQTRAIDLFSLGCVLFFCMTGGRHPFGDEFYERDRNVINNDIVNISLVEHIPEAKDLCYRLLNPRPERRPKASEVLLHPLFWSSEKRMSFIRDTSDWINSKSRRRVSRALETEGRVAFARTWDVEIGTAFISHMEQHGKYKYRYHLVQDLLRFIRNTMNHFGGLPRNIETLLKSNPEGLDDYFRRKFPKLLMVVYNVMYQRCRKEKYFLKYLKI